MKIGITGHTRGLGLAISQHMISQDHEVIGFSRSTGYDISIEEHRNKIIDIAKTCDIFFNNAHDELAQCHFLTALSDSVSVITSGSMASEYTDISGDNAQYRISKQQIQQIHVMMKRGTSKPMLLLRMGYLEDKDEISTISYSDIISAIDYWIEHPRVTMIEFDNHSDYYKEMLITHPKLIEYMKQSFAKFIGQF
jgi:hypothetical protein